jgi:hypothetical protein
MAAPASRLDFATLGGMGCRTIVFRRPRPQRQTTASEPCMCQRPLFPLVILLVLLSARSTQAGLDADDKKWLEGVRPLLLDSERKALESLKGKQDRQEFRKIFWARRDPDLGTPQNELQEVYEKRREEADQRFDYGTRLAVPRSAERDPGLTNQRAKVDDAEARQLREVREYEAERGSHTDCGLVYIVFGEPDQIEKRHLDAVSSREPQAWRYERYGANKFAFDDACMFPVGSSRLRVALRERLVVQPAIDYEIKAGELRKTLAQMMPKVTSMADLMRAPRQDFALAMQPAFLKMADGTGLFGLVRGDGRDLFHEAAIGDKVRLRLRIEASAAGMTPSIDDREVLVDLDTEGRFIASYRVGVKPGPNTVKVAVLDANSAKGSVLTEAVTAPELGGPVLSIASILPLADVTVPAPPDPRHPLAAFVIGDAGFVPRFGNVFRPSESFSISYQFYAPAGAPAPATTANLRIYKSSGGAMAQAPPESFDAAVGGSIVGPIPLARYPPGQYRIALEVADNATGKVYEQAETFEVKAEAASAAGN